MTKTFSVRCIGWLAASTLLALMQTARAQPCTHDTAPGTFPYHASWNPQTSRPTNAGIITQGFVDVRDEPVVHGIDVSKWQDQADFTHLRECLGKTEDASSQGGMHEPFVYVRISAGEDPDNETFARTHWYNARNQNLFVGPYHAFVFRDASSAYSALPAAQQGALLAANLASARAQASVFVQHFGQLLGADPSLDVTDSNYGKPYLPIVLTLMERPQSRFDVEDRRAIGKVYGQAACEWIKTVDAHKSFAHQRVMVFTSASLFHDYGLADAPCDLGKDGVWMSAHTLDGSRFGDLSDPRVRERAASLCRTFDKDSRCVFQQYTSYGGFALFETSKPLDLDRFYGSVADLSNLLQHAKYPELWKK
ncbi:glycoside hydrolase family 25 protein [Caballeronia sp. ATUFL_M2_KS44]|uniref:glycoside hydrolase family 25 protein n=1 Tax=Caballeronia sp. ATUFL_M2_KS44 TaxID=2921767 RepID=UPI0020293462|nr:glycoside hydrolase family 25 protein [Caballeronia sp. ATUFL_M2_KS44]